MTLISEIQTEVVESTGSLATALRKVKVLASELGVAELGQWAAQELDGYGLDDDLPPYRVITGENVGLFSGSFGRLSNDVPIPVSQVPDLVRRHIRTVEMRDGVQKLHTLAKASDGTLARSWPVEWVVAARDDLELSDGSLLAQACTKFPAASVEGILDSIRNKTLDFLLKLQEAHPELRTSDSATATIEPDEVRSTLNLTIYGSHNVVAGGSGINQSVVSGIVPGRVDTLLDYFRSIGVDDDDLAELHAAIEGDGELASTQTSFGSRVASWMGKMVTKAASGAWSAATSAASELIASALKRYYS